MTEDEKVGWHHRFNGHQFEQTQGVSEGQRGLACYSPWDHKESDMTQQMNNSYISQYTSYPSYNCCFSECIVSHLDPSQSHFQRNLALNS